jgi:hypothetical protein
MGIHQTGIQTQSVFFDSLYRMLEFQVNPENARLAKEVYRSGIAGPRKRCRAGPFLNLPLITYFFSS